MCLFKKVVKTFLEFILVLVWTGAYTQSIPVVSTEVEFAGVSLQLTPIARQRLQQSITTLYADRALLLNQIETLNQLRPLLDVRLTAQNVPLDFRYACLPFTESTYDPYAYWGLKQAMAEQLQLLINQSVDDRRHVLIATDAVLPYLNQLYQQKKHWIKALYQHLDASVKLPGPENNATHWLLDIQAPAVIWTILARKIAFEHEQALLKLTPTFILLDYNEGSGKTLLDIAGRLKINTDRLSPYNSWLLADRIPATGNFPVILRLTPAEYLAVKSRISTRGTGANTTGIVSSGDLGFPILRRSGPATTRQATIFYQINNRRGIQAQLCDNAITLAYYGGVSVPAFLTMNDLPGQDINLKPGEVYYLQRKEKRAKIPFHVVQQSQTLWDISAIYGIRLKSLLRYNRLKSNQRVQTGRIIWMQHRRPVRSPIEYQTVPAAKEPVPEQPAPVASDTTTIALPSSATPPPVTASVSPVTTSVIAPVVTTIIRKDSVTTKPVIVPGAVPASTPAASPSLGRITKVHVVKPGQTYFSISKLYGTTIEKLCTWNGLAVDEPLLVGQELLIDTLNPSTASPVRPAPTATKGPVSKLISPSASEKKLTYYFVKPKETIYRIALNHAVSVPDLMRWNGLKNFTIEVGQRLVIWQPGR